MLHKAGIFFLIVLGAVILIAMCQGYSEERLSNYKAQEQRERESRAFREKSERLNKLPPPTPIEPEYSIEDIKMIENIRAKAERDYPNEYSVQKFTIEKEAASYKYMKSVPDSPLKSKVQKDYPLDFSVQKFIYDKELDAKASLDQFKSATNSAMSKIPASTPRR